jgi:serine/threonine protein kinase
MVMDMAAGDLKATKSALDAAARIGILPEEARDVLNQFFIKQAVQGALYLRNQNMIHTDLKEDNILIGADGSVKVVDFGTSLMSDPTTGVADKKNPGGTPGYYADADQSNPTSKFDLFSLGTILEKMEPAKGGALSRARSAMTQDSPKDRPTLEAVLESSYLTNLEDYDETVIRELAAATFALHKAMGNQSYDKTVLDKPEVRQLANRVRDLSGRLRCPPQPATDESLARFLELLKSVVDSGAEFSAFLQMRAYADLFKYFQMDQGKLIGLAKHFKLNLSEANPNAKEDLKQALGEVVAFLEMLPEGQLRPLLDRGFKNMFRELNRQYQEFHKPQT